MVKKVEGRSGECLTEDGKHEYWWEGVNYHDIVPEHLIDAELAASNLENTNGGN